MHEFWILGITLGITTLAMVGCSRNTSTTPSQSQIKFQATRKKPILQPTPVVGMGLPRSGGPITPQEKAKAKGGLVWRRIPYSKLSKDERKDPNFYEGINPNTGQVEVIMNP